MADVLTRQDQIAAVLALASQQDMQMRSAGVVMLSRHPFERRAHIRLDLRHEPARENLEVGQVAPVLRIDDDPEVMPIPFAAPREVGRVHRILARFEEATLLTFDPSPLAGHIADVGHQRLLRARRHRHDPHLDHHPAHSARRRTHRTDALHRPLRREVPRSRTRRHRRRRPADHTPNGPGRRRLPPS